MDLGAAIVLVLIALTVVFLVIVEKNSRDNEARSRAELAAKTDVAGSNSQLRESGKGKTAK